MPRAKPRTLSEKKILSIMIVLTANKDVHDLLKAKGVDEYDIIALCDMAVRGIEKSKK